MGKEAEGFLQSVPAPCVFPCAGPHPCPPVRVTKLFSVVAAAREGRGAGDPVSTSHLDSAFSLSHLTQTLGHFPHSAPPLQVRKQHWFGVGTHRSGSFLP